MCVLHRAVDLLPSSAMLWRLGTQQVLRGSLSTRPAGSLCGSLRTVLSLPMPWLWFLPTLHRMAIVISAIWLAPLPAAGAGVPEPGGLVISETVVSFPQHQGLAHTQHRSPSDSAHRGRVAMVTLLLTVSRETAPWSWSYFAGLAEAGTEGWEDSRKDGRWGMRAACGCFPSGSICVCVHTRLLTLALHGC